MLDKTKWLKQCSLLTAKEKESRPGLAGIICHKEWHGATNGKIAAFINQPLLGMIIPEDEETVLLGDGEITHIHCPDLSKVIPTDDKVSSPRKVNINWEGINTKKNTCHRLEFKNGDILLRILSHGSDLLEGGIKVGQYTPATDSDQKHLFDAHLLYLVVGDKEASWEIALGERNKVSKIILTNNTGCFGAIMPIAGEF